MVVLILQTFPAQVSKGEQLCTRLGLLGKSVAIELIQEYHRQYFLSRLTDLPMQIFSGPQKLLKNKNGGKLIKKMENLHF